MDEEPRPGSRGEQELQDLLGSADRAGRFYSDQVLDHLNPEMRAFIARQELLFIGTADARGECDCSLRAGPPGFIAVLDESTLAYPEYRGNGVLASLGNMRENPHVGLLFVDFVRDVIGLHVNGRARIASSESMALTAPAVPVDDHEGRRAKVWVLVDVDEAYVHCSKHIPRLVPLPKQRHWGSDDHKRKGGDFFHVAAQRKQQALHGGGPAPASGGC